jgi:hypothetical protein
MSGVRGAKLEQGKFKLPRITNGFLCIWGIGCWSGDVMFSPPTSYGLIRAKEGKLHQIDARSKFNWLSFCSSGRHGILCFFGMPD